MSQSTPDADGFFMPAEWEPHERTWMAWPCREDLWGDRLEQARDAFAEVAKTIAQFEPVTMISRPGDVAEVSLSCGQGVAALSMEHDDSWTRDTGPTFLVSAEGDLAGVDWEFNGWGERYTPFELDAMIARNVLASMKLPRYQAPLIMEGGSFHTDGQGTLLVTEQCLLNVNRNRNLDRKQIEAYLKAFLSVTKIIWLGEGLEDDETDGHIDNLACFARPGMVLLNGCKDKSDYNHGIMIDAMDRLSRETDARGRSFEVVTIEQPELRRAADGERMALSYINFYICNNAVIMPSFESAQDQAAWEQLARIFPEREIVQVPALDILAGGGGIHCITQQQPARRSRISGS